MSVKTVLLSFICVQYFIAAAEIVNYTRCDKAGLTMELVYVNTEQEPYDLFALTRRSSCGKRAGTVTGTGGYAVPYSLTVDLSAGLTAQSPDCGVSEIGPGRYRLMARAAFSCEGATANDTDYNVDCDLDLPAARETTQVSDRSANYTCQAPSTIVFTYSQSSPAPPNDIYATGKELTCSRSANQGTGRGLAAEPYVLEIDTSDTANACGVTKIEEDTFSVGMYVQQISDLLTSADASYALTCNFTSLASQVISSNTVDVTGNVPVGTVNQNQPSASLFLVSASPSPSASGSVTDSVLSSYAVGDPVSLAAKLLNGPATGLRVRQCTASPGPGLMPQIAVLNDKGCSTTSDLIPPFIGESPSGQEAVTGTFPGFQFKGHDTVFFQCTANFCYGDSDLSCLGTHCDSSKRRKRDAHFVPNTTVTSDVITAYVTVRSNDVATNISETIAKSSKEDNSVEWTTDCLVTVTSLTFVCTFLLTVTSALGVKVFFMKKRDRDAKEKGVVQDKQLKHAESAIHAARSDKSIVQ